MAKLPTLKNGLDPLTWQVPIANGDGTPTAEFQRKWLQQQRANASIPDLTTAAGVSARLDLLGATPGMLLERGATTWGGLAPPSDPTKFLNGAALPAYAQVKDSDLSLLDITTNNVTNLKHGFAPKSPADVTKFLNGGANPAFAAVKDSDLSLSDITTNNATTAAHGFVPKLPNDATKYYDATGNFTVPPGSGAVGAGAASIQDDGTTLYVAISDADGQLIVDGSGDPIFVAEVFPLASIPTLPATKINAPPPTIQILTSGTNYVPTSPSVKWIKVRIAGGGGGGSGCGTTGPNFGSSGTASSFNSVTANPGTGATNSAAGVGGTGGTGTAVRTPGIAGNPPSLLYGNATDVYESGGAGGGFGSGKGNNAAPGNDAVANSGGGGGGGGTNGNIVASSAYLIYHGFGGGSGEIAEIILPAGNYTYAIGAKGIGGLGGTAGFKAGDGADGIITVEEHYI